MEPTRLVVDDLLKGAVQHAMTDPQQAPAEFTREHLKALRNGRTAVTDAPTVVRVTGSGAVDCLQGLFTNDVAKTGAGRIVYGAFLTAKGMIVLDAWIIRLDEQFLIIGAASRHEALRDYLRRQLPPRLARAEDLSEGWGVRWLVGSDAAEGWKSIGKSGSILPETVAMQSGDVVVARAPAAAPFSLVLAAPHTALTELDASLGDRAFASGTHADLDTMFVLSGWPRVDREIEEKTLPQEVRFDELRGVSYDKGCYVGQETVARLHFRGHTNRRLLGLVWDSPAPLTDDAIASADEAAKVVGRVTSSVLVETRRFGLGLLRREVEAGAEVMAGGSRARVSELPHEV